MATASTGSIAGFMVWPLTCGNGFAPKAELEFTRAQALIAHGIDTFEPLAWAKTWWRQSGPSHLITREIEGAISLQSFLFERRQGKPRRNAALQLAHYLARLHNAGVAHPDLHPGNIIVVQSDKDEPRFYLLDIHNVRIGKPLTVAESRANLIILNRWFILRSERSDRFRFWSHYVQARGWSSADVRGLARDLEAQTLISNCLFWNERFSRCLEANRYFRKVRSRVAKGHVVREMDEATLRKLLADPDYPFRDGGRLLKDSATSTVAEFVIHTTDGPRAMIYKRFRLKKPLAVLANVARQSSALRSWQMGYAMVDRQLPTPRPWLVLHRRSLTGPREGYLLCEKVEEAMEPQPLLKSLPTFAKREAIAGMGRLIERFHQLGLSHRDLKAPNLLFNAAHECQFIDLVGVRINRRSQAQQARDLSRLSVSFLLDPDFTRTDQLRFLRAYLCWGLRGSTGWKRWWKQIAEMNRAKIARNKRNGRALA